MDVAGWAVVATFAGGAFTGLGYGIKWFLDWWSKRDEVAAARKAAEAAVEAVEEEKKAVREAAEAEKRAAREAAEAERELARERQRWLDTVTELKEFNANVRTQLDHMTAEVLRLHEARVEDARGASDIRAEWERRSGECMKEVAILQGTVQLQTAAIRRLQAAQGDEAPGSTQAVTINADLDGVIRTVTANVGPVLGWAPAELIRKSVEVLVPERLREKFRQKVAELKRSGNVPWPEKAIVTHALTGQQQERAVTVNLKGWQTAGGEWMVGAEVRPLPAVPVVQVMDEGLHLPPRQPPAGPC